MGGNEPIKLNFGKKIGDVVLKKDNGIQRNAFKNDPMADLIFSHYKNGVDGILDSSGLELFYKDIETAAGKDKKLSESEARDFLKSIGMKDVKKSDARGMIKAFLDMIGGKDDNVEAVTRDGKNNINVAYKNGNEETYKYDEKSNKSVLYRQIYEDEAGTHTIIFENDGKTKASEEIRTNNTIKDVEYKNGKVDKETTLKDFSSQDISVGAELVPAGTKGIRIIKDANNNIKQELLDDDLRLLATREISADGKTIIQKDAVGKETARFEKDKNGELKQTVTDKNGVKIVKDGDKEVTQFSETRTMTKVGDTVTLKEGDKEVTLKYDDKDYLIAYAEEGETFKATAKRLGIDLKNEEQYKEFCELNKNARGKGWFKIGEAVRLPEGFEANLDVYKYEVTDIKTQQARYKAKMDAKAYKPENPENTVTRKKDEQGREIITETTVDGEVIREVINGEGGSRRVDGILELGMIVKNEDGTVTQTFDIAVAEPIGLSSFGVNAKDTAELKKKTDELTDFKGLYRKLFQGKATEDEKAQFKNLALKYLNGNDFAFKRAASVASICSGMIGEDDDLFNACLENDHSAMFETYGYGINGHEDRVEKLYKFIHSDKFKKESGSNYERYLSLGRDEIAWNGDINPDIAMQCYMEMPSGTKWAFFNNKDSVLKLFANPDNFDGTKTAKPITAKDAISLLSYNAGHFHLTIEDFRHILKMIPQKQLSEYTFKYGSTSINDIYKNALSNEAKKNFYVVQKGDNITKILANIIANDERFFPPANDSYWEVNNRSVTLNNFRHAHLKEMVADLGLKMDDKGIVELHEGQILDLTKIFDHKYKKGMSEWLGNLTQQGQNWQNNK